MHSWKHCFAGMAASTVLTASPVMAQTVGVVGDYYLGGSAGTATFFDDGGLDYDLLGFALAGQIGRRVTPELRVEGELAYEVTTAEDDIGLVDVDVDVTVVRPAISAFYDFNAISLGGMTPYAGAGIGLSFIEFDLDSGFGDDDDIELSTHVDIGAALELSDGLSIVPAARWELTDDASNIQLRVGARFWL